MKKIIVPTDFSSAAKNALDYAISLAKSYQAEIYLLNAYSMPHSGSAVMIDVSDVLKKDSTDKLEEENTRVENNLEGLTLKTISQNGSVAMVITQIAKHIEADLIVMGTTGATGLKEVFVGSNTADLIKATSLPLIAVPAGSSNKTITNVAVSVDLHHVKSPSVFDPLKDLVAENKASIKMINIADNMKSIDPVNFVDEAVDIDNMFFGIEHSFKFLEGKDVEEEILAYTKEDNVDLLVVVARKRNFFERLFHKSMSKKLTMHSSVPIMVLSDG